MIGNQDPENFLEELIQEEGEMTLKYTTQLSFDYQIASIYEDSDFRLDIPSPKRMFIKIKSQFQILFREELKTEGS
jgi:hypothetical protein